MIADMARGPSSNERRENDMMDGDIHLTQDWVGQQNMNVPLVLLAGQDPRRGGPLIELSRNAPASNATER